MTGRQVRALCLALAALAGLAGCGIDGPPLPPEPKSTKPGVSVGVSGTAEIGIVVD